MKYRIEKIETNVTWDERQRTGNLEVTIRIGGRNRKIEEATGTGLFLVSSDAYTEPVLTACVTDRVGHEMDRIFPLPLEEEIQFCMRVEEPQLWNAEVPYCYQLILEILEGEAYSYDRRVEPVAFYGWKIIDGHTCINDRAVVFRAEALPIEKRDTEEQRQFLKEMKQSWRNTLLITAEQKTEQLKKMCLEYGIYLLEDGKDVDAGALRAKLDLNRERDENPDFQIQVVQTGALIENSSTFANASEYELHYEILDASGNVYSQDNLCTDIPAGSSKYVDIPFKLPSEPGEYCYQVSLCLKEDTPWAPRGYAIASAETKISNLYERLE